jgi:GNAT superfamily N-acetyltransferase
MRVEIASFLSGYLNARGQSHAAIHTGDGFFIVRYGQPFNRLRELLMWDDSRAPSAALEVGDWVTIFHAGERQRPEWLPASFSTIASEFFMQASLPLRRTSTLAARRVGMDDLAALNAIEGLPAIDPSHAAAANVAYFAASLDGRIGATGRYGLGKGRDIVVDRMITLPPFRRRGLARSLLAAMDQDAQKRGYARMLLISSQDGYPLYQSMGFFTLAPVSVFAESPPPPA